MTITRTLALLSAEYRWTSFHSEDLSFAIRQVPLYGLLGHRFVVGKWRLESLAGGGLSLVHLKPELAAPDLEVNESSLLTAGSIRLALRIQRQLSRKLGAFTSLRADLSPSRRRLVLDDDGQSHALVSPLAVQPSLTLGLCFGD